MKLFLTMKAWELFLLLFVSPTLLPIAFALNTGENREIFFFLIMLFMVFLALCFYGWLWTLGIRLNKKVDAEPKTESRIFKYCMTFALLYILFFLLYPVFKRILGFEADIGIDHLMPFHFITLICIIYGFYFTSKHLVTIEKQKKASFQEYIGTIILFWFYPIGVWFIQPRVNKIFKES